jgi:hypothetical protein
LKVLRAFAQLSGGPRISTFSATQRKAHARFDKRSRNSGKDEETTMRNTLLRVVGALLIAAATTQIASAATTHQAGKVHHFRNANAAVVAAPTTPYLYSGGWSAPAGH